MWVGRNWTHCAHSVHQASFSRTADCCSTRMETCHSMLMPLPSCILIIATVILHTLLFFSSPPSEPGFAIVLKSCKFSSFPFGMLCIFRYKQIIINKNINMINKLYYLCLNKEDTCVYFCHILSDHKFCFFKLLIHFNP